MKRREFFETLVGTIVVTTAVPSGTIWISSDFGMPEPGPVIFVYKSRQLGPTWIRPEVFQYLRQSRNAVLTEIAEAE